MKNKCIVSPRAYKSIDAHSAKELLQFNLESKKVLIAHFKIIKKPASKSKETILLSC